MLQINSIYLSFFSVFRKARETHVQWGSSSGYTNWRFISGRVSEMRQKANKMLVPDTNSIITTGNRFARTPLSCLYWSVVLSICLSSWLSTTTSPTLSSLLFMYLSVCFGFIAIFHFSFVAKTQSAGLIQVNAAQCIVHSLGIYRCGRITSTKRQLNLE